MNIKSELDQHGDPVGIPVDNYQFAKQPSLDGPLVGKYCKLVELSECHVEPLFEAYSVDTTGRMWTYLPYGPFETKDAFAAHMNKAIRGDDYFLAILDANDTPIGMMAYMRISTAFSTIEIGSLTYSPSLQRTPASTEAMYLAMKQAFEWGYRRFEWKCNILNAPSIQAAHRFGLSFEGVFRQSYVFKGRNRDTAWLSLLDCDWPHVKAAFETWLAPDNFDEKGIQRQKLSDLTASIICAKFPNLTVNK